jgi:hypothetical protein
MRLRGTGRIAYSLVGDEEGMAEVACGMKNDGVSLAQRSYGSYFHILVLQKEEKHKLEAGVLPQNCQQLRCITTNAVPD